MFETPEDRSFLVDVADGVMRIAFNLPKAGNVTPTATVPHLATLFRDAQADPAIRCILVRGEGRVFSAGGDIASFSRSLEQDVPTRQADFARRLPIVRSLVEAVVAFDRPLIAVIRGAVAGAGLLYPLAADIAIGDPSATFVFAHQRIGLSPDGGVTALLPQVVSLRTARMLMLTAAKVDAAEAHRLGLLTHTTAAESLDDEAMAFAHSFARAPQRAIALAKRLVNAAPSRSLADQLDAETSGIIACVGEPDFSEGVRAFMEKRPASFSAE
jgi:2-(1,2-epoxy-1,2-dihydrophenyl)acetyl-CoA isomerase